MFSPQLARHYGDVFSIRLGSSKIVFVCGYKMVKEATLTQADNFVERPYNAVGNRFYSGDIGLQQLSFFWLISHWNVYSRTFKVVLFAFWGFLEGLLMSNGEIQKRQRRFALSTLRSFGMGQNALEQSILEEARHLLDEIEMEKGDRITLEWINQWFKLSAKSLNSLIFHPPGKPFNPANLFYSASSNIICQLVMAKRFDYSDHVFRMIQKKLTELVYLKGSIWGMVSQWKTLQIVVGVSLLQ